MENYKTRSSSRTEIVQIAFLLGGVVMISITSLAFYEMPDLDDEKIMMLFAFAALGFVLMALSFKLVSLKSYEGTVSCSNLFGKKHLLSIHNIHLEDVGSFNLSLFDPLHMSRFTYLKYTYKGKTKSVVVLNQSSFSGKVRIIEILNLIKAKSESKRYGDASSAGIPFRVYSKSSQ